MALTYFIIAMEYEPGLELDVKVKGSKGALAVRERLGEDAFKGLNPVVLHKECERLLGAEKAKWEAEPPADPEPDRNLLPGMAREAGDPGPQPMEYGAPIG